MVFVPISLRFDTHRPSVFLALLAHGLTKAYEGDAAKLAEKDPDVLLSMAADYLRRPTPPPNRRGVLVVLDGLDEATWPPNGEAWKTLFPGEPPAHLRVTAAARVLATADVPAWLRRLGWHRGQTTAHELEHLSLQGVREVLAQMHVPLDALSRDVDLVQTLYRLTDEGDPLLVGLYAQDLLDTLEAEGEAAAQARARQIAELVGSGYATFFEGYWWPEQRKLWEAQGLPGDTEARVREILDLLALARGPIPEADLLALARRAPGLTDLDTYVLDQVWENLARIVIRRREGKHTLFTFSHPRMREYFAEERLQRRDPARSRDLEARYRDWMRAEVARIADGEEAVPDASPYVLRYALDHLAGEPLETWRPLVDRPAWHRSRHAQEGDYAGFLEDVHAIWKRAGAENRHQIANRQLLTANCSLPHIGLEIRCALIEASIHSLAGNLPPELPALLVENDLWTPAQALAHLRQMPDDWKQAEALRALAPVLARQASTWLAQALDVVRSMEYEWLRAEALAALAPYLPEEEGKQALAEALAATRSIESEWHRSEALAALAPHLPEGLLAEALAAARSIEWEFARARALAALAPHLPEGERAQVLAEALAAARSIWHEDARAEVLAALAPHLPEEEGEQALAEALAAARELPERDSLGRSPRARALAALAPHLPEAVCQQALAEALAAARELPEQSSFGRSPRAEALAALAPHLPEGVLGEALAAAQNIQVPEDVMFLPDPRAEALAALAPHLPEGLLAKALVAARSIEQEPARAEALAALAPHLPEGLLAEALAAAGSIRGADARAEALAALAPHLPEGVLAEALAAVCSMEDERHRSEALAALAPHLTQGLLAQALGAACSIERGPDRAKALAAFAPHLPEGVLAEALAAAPRIEYDDDRARALAALAPQLAQLPCATLYPLWAESLSLLARRTRRNLLSDLRALQEVVSALGGEAAMAETAHAIRDVGRWWP